MVPACRHCRHWDRPAAMRQTDARLVSEQGANLVTGADVSLRNFAMLRRAPHPSNRCAMATEVLTYSGCFPITGSSIGSRPPLWWSLGPRQIFMTSLLTGVLGLGPAAMMTADVPDLHHFRGSFGGKDVIPLWRNSAADEPNITEGLLNVICQELGQPVSP